MNGKIAHIVYIVALLVGLYSCQDDISDNGINADGNYLSFTLSTRATDMARSPEEGEDRFNENLIEKVDVYFFTSNSDNEKCVYAQMDLTPSRTNTTEYALQIPLDKEKLTNQTYYVYIVANSDDFSYTSSTAEGVSLQTIKETTITTEWKSGYADNNTDPIKDAAQVKESSLVMDGGDNITIDPMPTAPEIIEMTRAMAKVMLFPTTAESIVTDGVTYTPIPGSMNVTMVYGVQQTNLQGNYAVQETDYIERIIRGYNQSETDEDGKIVYEQAVPFYSYPNPESTSNRKDTYLVLCVPWSATINGSQQALKYYYRVPISGSDAPAILKRNTYYRIKVNIGVLGSLNPHDAVEVTDKEFEIMPWINTSINADMNNYRYLVLDEYNSVMNNVNVLEMPYVSSSDIDLNDQEDHDGYYTKITEVSFWDYREINAQHVYYGENQGSSYEDEEGNRMIYRGDIPDDYHISVEGNNLVFSHPLNDAEDYVAITIKITAYNKQGVKADEWTITQYPAMYIEGKKAEGRLYVAGEYTTRRDEHPDAGWNRGQDWWYDHVNYDNYYLGSVQNPESVDGTANNRNPNNYTIYVSSFDEGDNYIIGDPRTLQRDNLELEGLSNYYPSRTDDEAMRIVAPAFKIASSRGKTQPVLFSNAQRRCAAYQEDGYGAGRWRVPTEAEIEYIINLSRETKIPALFDGEYWSASGRYYSSTSGEFEEGTITGKEDDQTKQAVRCVYDVWYWGDEPADKYTFGWRDE